MLVSHSKFLRHLAKYVELDNPKEVKLFIVNKRVMDYTREKIVNVYDSNVKSNTLNSQLHDFSLLSEVFYLIGF